MYVACLPFCSLNLNVAAVTARGKTGSDIHLLLSHEMTLFRNKGLSGLLLQSMTVCGQSDFFEPSPLSKLDGYLSDKQLSSMGLRLMRDSQKPDCPT